MEIVIIISSSSISTRRFIVYSIHQYSWIIFTYSFRCFLSCGVTWSVNKTATIFERFGDVLSKILLGPINIYLCKTLCVYRLVKLVKLLLLRYILAFILTTTV